MEVPGYGIELPRRVPSVPSSLSNGEMVKSALCPAANDLGAEASLLAAPAAGGLNTPRGAPRVVCVVRCTSACETPFCFATCARTASSACQRLRLPTSMSARACASIQRACARFSRRSLSSSRAGPPGLSLIEGYIQAAASR
ncbi:hypothetical protein T492DRAFT_43966 [Pavlovales sp. CCMP2436]|nr:hypothetical protein T492DRAFT_43966 [Pavlovales sp. CCMP2436]